MWCPSTNNSSLCSTVTQTTEHCVPRYDRATHKVYAMHSTSASTVSFMSAATVTVGSHHTATPRHASPKKRPQTASCSVSVPFSRYQKRNSDTPLTCGITSCSESGTPKSYTRKHRLSCKNTPKNSRKHRCTVFVRIFLYTRDPTTPHI